MTLNVEFIEQITIKLMPRSMPKCIYLTRKIGIVTIIRYFFYLFQDYFVHISCLLVFQFAYFFYSLNNTKIFQPTAICCNQINFCIFFVSLFRFFLSQSTTVFKLIVKTDFLLFREKREQTFLNRNHEILRNSFVFVVRCWFFCA